MSGPGLESLMEGWSLNDGIGALKKGSSMNAMRSSRGGMGTAGGHGGGIRSSVGGTKYSFFPSFSLYPHVNPPHPHKVTRFFAAEKDRSAFPSHGEKVGGGEVLTACSLVSL